ncbi:MAG: GNAT family N-acetyltransferase [Actinomycetota bacterium]
MNTDAAGATLRLVDPSERLHVSWLESRDEWGRGVHQPGTGLWLADDLDLDSAEGFSTWLARLRRESDTSVPPDPGKVHASYWWIVEGERYLGAITLRYDLNEYLLQVGGHIGFGIRPSARRRGLARWALRAVLPRARALGLDRVLVTCDDDNVASARTIESNGGVLEDVREVEGGPKRRYWVDLATAPWSDPSPSRGSRRTGPAPTRVSGSR